MSESEQSREMPEERRPFPRALAGLRALGRVEARVRTAPGTRGARGADASSSAAEERLLIEEIEEEARPGGGDDDLGRLARRVAVATVVVIGLVALALALWKVKLAIALLFLAFTIAAAMRPGVEALHRRGLPRAVGVAVHYVVLFCLVALFLWLVVPTAVDQVQAALGGNSLQESAANSTGIKHDILTWLDDRLHNLPSASELFHPALTYGKVAFEVVVGVFFTFASAAYWIFERDRAVGLIASLVARPKRKKLRDTWLLVDLKLGAFVRGQLILIVFVGVVLSLLFWVIGLPYWLLVGPFAGLVELIPVIGPLLAGVAAVGIGLTASVHVAVLAGLAVLAVRLLEDYLVVPRVLGHSVGLSPLVVLVSVTAVGLLFGGFAVILAIPIASLAATLIDVLVRNRNPADEDVPTVIFPAKGED